METTRYAIAVTTELSFAEADARVRDALKEQGFGVLTEIDVAATLKEKLGVEHRPYVILGACNPPLANQALGVEEDIGLLLPCNVVVYEADGGTRIAAIDPETMVGFTDNPELAPIAGEARARLEKALASLGG
jgi:uncharacterized protein (DUF302 family)